MIFIGDYFALGFVIMIFLFFTDCKFNLRHLTTVGKLFTGCLLFTCFTALVDMYAGFLNQRHTVPHGVLMFWNTVYFVIANIATTFISRFIFIKILEHTHNTHCLKRSTVGLVAVFFVHLAMLLANIEGGFIFTIENNTYVHGPLNILGYFSVMCQIVLVLICYFRNFRNASRMLRRVLLQTIPMVALCIILQRLESGVMLSALAMAMACVILFLTFLGQQQGVHALTQLNDRHRFFREVDKRIEYKEPFQVFMINIKDFGALNRKYGHVFGDEYLYQFAFSLDKLFPRCMSFHMNGTVFALLMRYTYQNISDEQCNKLLSFLENGIVCQKTQVTTNYVLSHYVADGTETTATKLFEVLEYASTSAYKLKNRYVRCTPEIMQQLERMRYLQERMQTIDTAHGFEVWFQPIKNLSSGKFASMEALIRMREPDGTFISPAEFIPLAEQTGQVNSITWFVLTETCRLLRYKPELEGISVSINVPMTQMLEKGFAPRFKSIVDQAGIKHEQICIEFTERAIIENFQQLKSIMDDLSDEGFRFFLDDFGEGYSNFNCILQLPFDIIKLDRSLMKSNWKGEASFAMIRTLTKLLHDMDLTVVAEGAETALEVKALAMQGVDLIQGFALAVPMPVEKLIPFYREHPMTLM